MIPCGKDKLIAATASRTRVNLTGAINLASMRVLSESYKTINGDSTIAFLKTLLEANPDAPRIHVILDQAGYHRSKDVADFASKNRIKRHHLPPYSPNLNPIERLWKVMNEYVRNNRFFSTAKEFREAIDRFFKIQLPAIAPALRSRINDNFPILKSISSV